MRFSPEADLAIVVGANDVVNPAAMNQPGTPIYGMPIIRVDQARHVLVLNYDTKPGYAGVPNSLYEQEHVSLLLGDAKETLEMLLDWLRQPREEEAPSGTHRAAELLAEAQRVIIVPGYGMALAAAQRQVKQLVAVLQGRGTEVKIAIHPVAGRMPGHMNVLLAEVDIPYDLLYDLDEINHEFAGADVAVVVGANDVVNPAAQTAEGTPIYGMPVLHVHEAGRVVVQSRPWTWLRRGAQFPLRPASVPVCGRSASETLQQIIDALAGRS